jgi:predicted negative regulator of RcsB-dependent stress response
VNRKFRKQIKGDKFAQEVGATVSWVDDNKDLLIRYGALALAVILVAGGIYLYVHHQSNVREEAFAQALRIDAATVGAAAAPAGGLSYPTQPEKDKARTKAFTDISVEYHGSEQGAMAQMYLASDAADKGDLPSAERMYKDVVDSAPKEYSSMARLSLANVYVAEGKQPEAEKLLRDAVAHPTITVSKEEATIHLAKVIMKTNPDEARKLLEPLRMIAGRTAISRAAVTTLGEMASTTK